MKRGLYAFLVLFSLVLAILAFWNLLRSQIFLPRQTLTVAEARFPAFALVYIADKKGYFEELNLNVAYNQFSLGKDALDDVVAGNSDIATVYETPFVRQVYNGEELYAIASLHTSQTSTALLGLKSHGVHSAQDLVGKKIGVVKGTNAEFFLHSLLLSAGVEKGEVTLAHVSATEIADVIMDGEVDAVAIYHPVLFDLRRVLADDATIIYSDTYTENSVLAVRKETVDQKGAALLRFIQALHKAEVFVRNNKQESIELVARSLPDVPLSTVEGVWDDYTYTLELNNVLLAIMSREAQWMRSGDLSRDKEIPDFRGAMFGGYLKAIDPDLVTLY